MQAVSFYLVYPWIYLVASLSFNSLYRLSDFLYYILWYSGYRKKVVLQNLRNSFPEKSPEEIEVICKDYYHYLCDLTLETLKTLKMTEAENRERCHFNHADWLDQFHRENKSFIIVMGHYGNWEWAGPCFTLNTNFQLVVIYRPLKNVYFENMLSGMRTRFGTRITATKNTLRDIVANRKNLTATAFIADQTANIPQNAYWTTFLNQDTAVFVGPEKLAFKFNYPVVYMNVKRVKRGFYEVSPELLLRTPKESAENEISEAFTKRLEKEILADPSIWLWSHKRWKHKRPTTK
ncbi:MAG TPA: lysophospholipid acyltransferase family protein [Cyclobacteriaceae bacterium]|jgi:KDO2-lipid IV(A) lauroyltransferase|nr:lysophospholipid acyltransferase family protein [Cyclobacteriaceae bacterium]